jgi:transcriptional regulator with XRE-family HTH domain
MSSSREELGRFLRSRRDRLRPSDVGLPANGRRRAPGLRREEVAQLAGVGVTWYTWLEQGRDANASEQVLVAIAKALRLDADEYRHVLTLGGIRVEEQKAPVGCVTAEAELLIEKLMPYPACIQSSRFDFLAFNRAYRFLNADLESIPAVDRNCLRLNFLNPTWADAYVDRDAVSASMVARLRSTSADHLDDPAWTSFISEVYENSPAFRELWDRHDVRRADRELKRFDNPRVGLLTLHMTSLWLDEQRGTRLVSFTPADTESAERLELLAELTEGIDGRQLRVA